MGSLGDQTESWLHFTGGVPPTLGAPQPQPGEREVVSPEDSGASIVWKEGVYRNVRRSRVCV